MRQPVDEVYSYIFLRVCPIKHVKPYLAATWGLHGAFFAVGTVYFGLCSFSSVFIYVESIMKLPAAHRENRGTELPTPSQGKLSSVQRPLGELQQASREKKEKKKKNSGGLTGTDTGELRGSTIEGRRAAAAAAAVQCGASVHRWGRALRLEGYFSMYKLASPGRGERAITQGHKYVHTYACKAYGERALCV